jgi:hypothetical protein
VQGDPARLRQLAVGYGTLRAVRAEAPVLAPRIEAELRLEGDRVTGTIRNASPVPLEKPTVVLGTGVAVLADLAPGATAHVDLRAQPDAFGRALSERIFGQPSFSSDGRPTADYLRDQVRRQLVDALTYDPFFGSNGTLPADGPVLLAWGRPGLFAVTVAGQEPRTAGETLYYLPLGLVATGPVAFTPDLMRSSLVETNAQFFNKDPFNLTIGGGSATLAFRPIPVSGRLVPTRLALGVNLGMAGPLAGGGTDPGSGVEPAAPTAEPAGAVGPGAGEVPPKPAVAPDAMGLPRFELFDRGAGAWREVALVAGKIVEIRAPGRFVDPASGTILLRLTNDRQDAVGFQLAIQLEGEME